MSIISNLQCYAQHIVDTETSNISHIELLSRVRPIDRNIPICNFLARLTPNEFLEIIKWQIGIANDIYDGTRVKCTINVPNSILSEPELVGRFLLHAASNRGGIMFEFTEEHPMPAPGIVNPIFQQLRALNCQIALDDFGTGFNGMSLFVDYDFDIIKIDRTIVASVVENNQRAKIVKLIAEMIKTLGKTPIAEGIETPEQKSLIVDCGISLQQGFLFHKPEPFEIIFRRAAA
jgi:EAL domain-containing protein (putative c-di-GMP-specific phosphodiesterase class I)